MDPLWQPPRKRASRALQRGMAFTEGRAIDEVATRARRDAGRLSLAKLDERYTRAGLDKLMDQGPLTSLQVRSASALLRDQFGIEYTPVDGAKDGQTRVFAARIPKSASRRLTESAREGLIVPASEAVGVYSYPAAGTELELERIHDKHAAKQNARIEHTEFNPKRSVAVAMITMSQPVDTQHTAAERTHFERARARNKRRAAAAAEESGLAGDTGGSSDDDD